MKNIKLMSVVLSAVVAVSLFAGCSNEKKDDGLAAGADKSNEPVTLEYYSWFDEESYTKKILDAYKAKHSNVTINATFVPNAEYGQKLLVALSGGTGIDIFCQASPPGYATYVQKQQAMPLDDLIKNHGYNTKGVQDFINQIKMDGKVYGLPYRKSSWVLYYNKDIFDKAGVKYPDASWTWDTYGEMAKKLTSGEGNNKIWGSLSFAPTSSWWRVPANTMGANNPLKKEDLEAFKKAAKLAYDLSYTYNVQQPYSDRVGTAGGDYIGTFLQGKTAMFYTGDWGVEMINRQIKEKNVAMNYDIAPMPHWEGKEAATTGSPALMMINKNSKKADAAFELMKFASSEDGAKIIAESGLMPAWNSDAVNDAFLKRLQQPSNGKFFFTQKVNSQVPTDPLYDKAMKIVTDEVSLYLLKERDLDSTFVKIQQRIKDEVN